MFRSHLLWRLYTGYVVIILVSTTTVGILLSRQLTQNSLEEIERSLAARAELLAELARPTLLQPIEIDSPLQATIVALGSSTESRLTVITSDGRVIADSQELPQSMDDHSQRPEVLEALVSGIGLTSRFSQTLQQQMMYLARTVENNGQEIGFVRVSLPLSTIDNRLAELRSTILLSAMLVAVFALLIGFYFAKRFADPVVKLTEAAEAISQGDYDRRINLQQRDEIGDLAQAFNRMARSSSQRMAEITTDHTRLTMLFAGMVEGVIDVDEKQNIVHINAVAAGLLDISISECIDQPIWQHVRDAEIISALEQAIESNEVVKTQMRRSSTDGDTIVDIYAVALQNDDREPLGALIVLHDISELDHLERIRRDFVANASHELKTPITAIRGLTETILEDPDMDGVMQREFIDKAHVQSLRLSALVTDLMTISRLESDQAEQNFQNFDFRTIINSSETAMKPICEEKELQLEISSPDKQVTIHGDFQAISQLVDNLTDNAIKYSDAGGSVSLSLTTTNDNAILVVKDSGIGISPLHQQRIFERFYRVDRARSRELGGTGLGLSIVKNIAEQHGGSVSLSSQPGVGSSFTVTLPLTDSS
ncbi:MAG TPA: hypothetical protein DCM64_10095 [Gammaproteobacteria bacterium]|jgi:two-component system phosphate regulon sensor histidine kinase PhoR|nr:ATP-binding protein [Gammaproteobacteria bacterium]MDP6733035.1 ATP-binding protein [Gammaproteobacteria bacterium]HAJ76793.1 hypothetical protein [Gammaproteobacteria bacterium]|tara:strand:+ start:2088 stop:3875 length:1788 start_codon:yes stop_codon:yes gene_type:complete